MIEKPPKSQLQANIFKLLSDPENSKILKEINDDYLYWDKVKYKKSSLKNDQLWQLVKINRKISSTHLRFGKHIFSFSTTDYIQQSIHHFDMNIGGYMAANNVIPDSDKTQYLVSSIMEEAISSSQMEGANTTRIHAKNMLRKGIKPRSISEQMIFNNFYTIKHIAQHKNDDLSPENLLQLHGMIAKDTLTKSEDEACFRDNDEIYVVDHITSEIVHSPPNHKEIPGLIKDLCDFFNEDNDKKFIHPIIKGIILHFMIGWIHPFSDGNGRTARTLFYWYLLKKGYWLTEYLSISKVIKDSKSQYEKAYLYTENDENDLSYFITYNLKVMEKAFEALKSYIARKQKETLQVANFLRIPGVNDRQAQMLKLVFDQPQIVFNIKEVENRYGVSNYTARTDLKGLVSLGLLEMIPVNKVKQNFVKATSFDKTISKYIDL